MTIEKRNKKPMSAPTQRICWVIWVRVLFWKKNIFTRL